MKTYKFEKTVYYADNYNIDITVFDDTRFCEYQRYSDKQRFYFTIIKNPQSEEVDKVFKKAFHRVVQIGTLKIGILSNVKPLCEIPEITIDEVNKIFVPELRQMYIVSNCKNSQYMYLNRDLIQMCIKDNKKDLKDCLETPEAIEIMDKLKTMQPTYIESIIRPIKFVKDSSCHHGPALLCDIVQFKSWLDISKDVDTFTKTTIDTANLTEYQYFTYESKKITYMGEAAKPWKEMFEKRIAEITRTAFE